MVDRRRFARHSVSSLTAPTSVVIVVACPLSLAAVAPVLPCTFRRICRSRVSCCRRTVVIGLSSWACCCIGYCRHIVVVTIGSEILPLVIKVSFKLLIVFISDLHDWRAITFDDSTALTTLDAFVTNALLLLPIDTTPFAVMHDIVVWGIRSKG